MSKDLNNKIDVRRLLPDEKLDCKKINELFAQQTPEKTQGIINEKELREVLSNPLLHIFVVFDSNENGRENYLGMATIFFQKNLAKWIAEIHDVVVNEEHRGRGVGKTLINKILEDAREFCKIRNVKLNLYLTCRPSRVAANSLYLKLGFVQVAKAHGEWGTNLYKIIVEPQGLRGLP